MSETKVSHTPTPYRWDGDDLWHFGSGYEIKDGDQPDPHRYTGITIDKRLRASPVLKANKELMALACNSHDALLAACKASSDYMGIGLGSSEHFEKVAEEFRRETGMIAPGKSIPLGMNYGDEYDTKRRAAWEAWHSRKRDALEDTLTSAIAQAEPTLPPGE